MRRRKTFFEDMLTALEGLKPEEREKLKADAKAAGVPLQYFIWTLYNRHVRKTRREGSIGERACIHGEYVASDHAGLVGP
jgi:hypothetical protein